MSKVTNERYNDARHLMERYSVPETAKKTGISETTLRRIKKSINFTNYKTIALDEAGGYVTVVGKRKKRWLFF